VKGEKRAQMSEIESNGVMMKRRRSGATDCETEVEKGGGMRASSKKRKTAERGMVFS
jgi:hypothetical protein